VMDEVCTVYIVSDKHYGWRASTAE